VVQSFDRPTRIIQVLEDLDGEHGIEEVGLPGQIVDIALDVGIPRGIDVEPHIAGCRHVLPVRRRFGADVEDKSRLQATKLAAKLAIERQTVD
jgi:hypothetical protein